MNEFYNSKNNGIHLDCYDPSSMIIRKMEFIELIHAKINWALVGGLTSMIFSLIIL